VASVQDAGGRLPVAELQLLGRPDHRNNSDEWLSQGIASAKSRAPPPRGDAYSLKSSIDWTG
jgi:hypothetical protein